MSYTLYCGLDCSNLPFSFVPCVQDAAGMSQAALGHKSQQRNKKTWKQKVLQGKEKKKRQSMLKSRDQKLRIHHGNELDRDCSTAKIVDTYGHIAFFT